MSKDAGGPAFPWVKVTVLAEDGTANESLETGQMGMTLRDWFAAHASDTDIADLLHEVPRIERVVEGGSMKRIIRGLPANARQIARYMHADLMLKARQQ